MIIAEKNPDKRLQSGEVFRMYVNSLDYLISGRTWDGEPTFLTFEGLEVSRTQIEQTADYFGFAEAVFGLLPRKPDDVEYMEGYRRAQINISRRLLPAVAGL